MKKPTKGLKGKGKPAAKEPVQPDARVFPVVAAIERAAALLDEETASLADGRPMEVEPFLERKREAEAAVRRASREAVAAGLSVVPGTPEALAVEAGLHKMQAAAQKNAEALQGAKNALDHVAGLMRKSSSEKGSEGMYNRSAAKVASRERTMLGFGAAI